MSSTSALLPYAFEGHCIWVSTDQQGEAWLVTANNNASLGLHPKAKALGSLRAEDHYLHSPKDAFQKAKNPHLCGWRRR